MSGCSSTYNSACPSPVQTVNVHQTLLSLAAGSGSIELYTNAGFTGTQLTLPDTPLVGYAVGVYVNGLLQGLGTHYTISGDAITFVNALAADDVQVTYASATNITSAAQVFNYTATISGTQVLLPRVPGTSFPVTVYVNGVLQALTTHYTVSSNIITFTYELASDTVQVVYSA